MTPSWWHLQCDVFTGMLPLHTSILMSGTNTKVVMFALCHSAHFSLASLACHSFNGWVAFPDSLYHDKGVRRSTLTSSILTIGRFPVPHSKIVLRSDFSNLATLSPLCGLQLLECLVMIMLAGEIWESTHLKAAKLKKHWVRGWKPSCLANASLLFQISWRHHCNVMSFMSVWGGNFFSYCTTLEKFPLIYRSAH